MRIAATCLLVLGLLAGSRPVVASDEDFFEKEVRPILVAKCLECHGDELPEADFKVTSRDNILQGGTLGPAAVAHKPDESRLIAAILRKGKLKMPPDEPLRESQIAVLRKWVELGLPWPGRDAPPQRGEMVVSESHRQHWSFRPVTSPPIPETSNNAWVRTPVDAFVLSKLETKGLKPSVEADRRTLIRRLTYDLTGLPPTFDEVQAFVNDSDPAAYERLVDRLLASPRYGERWGRHWLDVARFADSKDGVLMYGDDRVRPFAYTYRDYVIRAFNEDTPYNRFIEEQLAADQIEPAVEPWRLAAMGYLTLGRMYDNNLHDIIDDQIDTVTRGFLGLTVACARCHDHKYDPIPTADYYSLYGVFASSEAPFELPLVAAPEQIAGGVEFEKEVATKRVELLKMLDDQYALLTETARQRVGDYLERVATTPPDLAETAIFFLSLSPEDLRPQITARWRRLVTQRATPSDPVFGPWFALLQLPNDEATFATQATQLLEQLQSRAEGINSDQLNPLVREALKAAPLKNHAAVARVYGDLLRRVYEESKAPATGTASPPVDAAARGQLLALLVGPESPGWFAKSQTRRYMSRTETDQFSGKAQELDRLAVKSPNAPPRAMVVNDAPTLCDPVIFVRGNASQRGKPVPRQFLAILSPENRAPFAKGGGRLDLARAIAAPDNPLTARVLVNRVWMHHFGEPLVSTPSDFGTRSTMPEQLPLLDHLATRFVQEGWSLKKLHKWIVLSNTWRQSSTNEAALAADLDNKFLGRMNRRRLEFETMRDTLLAVSGRLTERLQPDSPVWTRPVDIVGDPKVSLRTVYGLVDRQNLPGLFRAFDFATPDSSNERRPRTVVPQQALFALNSPFMLEQVKALATKLETVPAGPDRISSLYKAVYAREPSAEDQQACAEFLALPREAGSQLTPWEQLAQVLLASNELMYLD